MGYCQPLVVTLRANNTSAYWRCLTPRARSRSRPLCRSKTTFPTVKVPVSPSANSLIQPIGTFFRPGDDMCTPHRDRLQTRGACVGFGGCPKILDLIVIAIGSNFAVRHRGESRDLKWPALAPGTLTRSFSSHSTTVPRRKTRRTLRTESTSTTSANLPASKEPMRSSPRMVAPCTEAM